MQTTDYANVPGVSECRLDEVTLAELPANEAPAPWDCELSGLVWWCRGGRAATQAAGSGAPGGARGLAVLGGFVAYDRTPVGRYSEVYGGIGVRRRRGAVATIPFMAVDSRASLVGGRGNWSLPKCLAEFTGRPGEGTVTARGSGWTVRATARPFGPQFPLPMTARMVQPWPDGARRESLLRGKARARSAIVTVEVESEGELADWLRPGRHLGAVLSHTSFTLSESR
jgi:hypothetical protein